MAESTQPTRGTTASAISNGAVRLFHEYTGRGPTKARTTINGDNVLILFGDVLTKGERMLAENGDAAAVLQMRHRFQDAMRGDLVGMVEGLVGRKVVAFMSANHISPDMAAEVFVLEPLADTEETATIPAGTDTQA
jgi:uncharacterized protein YbcI